MKTYTPQQDSVAWKVIEFFTTNPDEELTLGDLESKFDKKASNFHSLLGAAVEANVLKRQTNNDDELVYSLGTGVPVIGPSKARNPSLRPDVLLSSGNMGAKRAIASPINLAEVVIRDDVPLPGRGSHITDWPALFARMKVKQSCVLPMAARSVLNKACTDAKKAGQGTFALRKIDDEQIGLWRLK